MSQPTKEQQKILQGFKKLREEQQFIVSEITRFSAELRETQSVLKSINGWDNTDRKFYYRAVDALLEVS
ncbi:Prefoldin-2 protein [Aphelenchoides fujianensis]|nr:Prefoldin-2 protein [Aphelenchoides fujianensis]